MEVQAITTADGAGFRCYKKADEKLSEFGGIEPATWIEVVLPFAEAKELWKWLRSDRATPFRGVSVNGDGNAEQVTLHVVGTQTVLPFEGKEQIRKLTAALVPTRLIEA